MSAVRVGRFRFAPRLWPSVATAVLLPLLLGLGVWQLGRAADKRLMEQTFSSRMRAPAMTIDAAAWRRIKESGGADELAYRRVVVDGTFLGARQYLLDNRTRKGVAGFEVLTALMPDGADGGVVVNRGWVPLDGRRDDLPEYPAPAGRTRVTGFVDWPRAPPPLLGPSGYAQAQWPKIVQRVDLDVMAEQLGAALLPLTVLLDPDAPGGFIREWKPYYGISASRHQAYAFQWFSLAAALVVIFVVVNAKRIEHE